MTEPVDMHGTQPLHPEAEPSSEETMTAGDDDDSQLHDFQDDGEEHEDNEGFIHAPGFSNLTEESQDNMTQDLEDNVYPSIEAPFLESGTPVPDDADATSLFVPENGSPTPPVPRREGPAADMPPPPRPSTVSCQPTAGISTLAKIRNMQKKYQEKKNASTRRTPTHINTHADNEAYLEAVMSGITPTFSTPVPAVDDDDMADREAIAEFARNKRHYDELKLKNGGKLSFRHDIEWMKIKNAEDARKKKRQRDLAKAQDSDDEGLNLFPTINPAVNDVHDNDSDDGTFNFDDFIPRKRPRQLPRKGPKQISMMDAELHSMQVALEAEGDMPRKKKKVDESQGSATSSARSKGSKAKSTKSSKEKAPPKKAGNGPRNTAKKKREIDHVVKQATSLFNSNVFQQQAGAGATEQPTFKSRVKADALKELIASVPIGDQTKARGEMNTLLAATKEFDGKGSVKSDGAGHWLVKGMKTSLKAYQVLGTAFMRKRENATEEPRGGLMADQMGLGKTLMMLGMLQILILR